MATATEPSVLLFWLPLGAGGHVVRLNGLAFEAVDAAVHHRRRQPLFHAALEVRLEGHRHAIEQGPVWGTTDPDRGVACEGPVGSRWLGRSRLFRYEVRCWRDGVIPDVAEAVGGPRHLGTDRTRAAHLLDLVPDVPRATWGRDEQRAGEMWSSNSVVAWLLARSGHDVQGIAPPTGGRAPGWHAGLVVAARHDPEPTR
ncbi:hypothetical protein EXE57_02420 [Nocardioides euryhalodurans]|uniref:Uncharacterized protein n=1 Tax=Nocardioides euryhalodurans TaxID=2518370 RepID=A0A4P7GPV8_9ACTN|nr:hypothetical protein EXE57_02420 [Nocardioides euryhalodurans]